MERNKQEIRQEMWDVMTRESVARFPGAHGRIPNFEGAESAAQRLTGLDIWRGAEVIKCNPDSPQRPVREQALLEGKLIYMAVPRLRDLRCFIELDPERLSTDEIRRAATIKGAFHHGHRMHISEMKSIDLVVAGSVAVNEQGSRLGKGGGYSDLEYALGRTFQLIDEHTPIITTVHPIQIVQEKLPRVIHDIPVDIIVTSEEAIETRHIFQKPAGIYWHLLPEEKIEAIPILQSLQEEELAIRSNKSGLRQPTKNILLLTGLPGSGKTTAIQKILSRLAWDAGGFYTEEIREEGRRKGFRIITLDGREGILAHVNIRGKPRISKYGVNLKAIDDFAVRSIYQAIRGRQLVIIDEIGPMEILSESFRQAVLDALHSGVDILGSIVKRGHPFADSIKAISGVSVLEIHPRNRDWIVEHILKRLMRESDE